jgi:GABA permease
MVRLLLVANKTLASGEVSDFVKDRMAKEEDCRFTLLVPATPRSSEAGEQAATAVGSAGGGVYVPQQGAGEDNWEHARRRLEYGLDILRKLGATVDGEVGDPNPAKAISDVLKRRSYDEVALSTLPKGVSRWLGLDIPHQVQRKFHVPVTVITVKRVPS